MSMKKKRPSEANLGTSSQLSNPVSEDWLSKIRRWIGSPAFAAVVTFLVVLAGAAASFFTDSIKKQPPLVWITNVPEPDQVGTLLFWGLVILSIVLLYLNQRGVASIAKQERFALQHSLSQLDDAVRRLNTLPTKNFLPAFQDSFREALATTILSMYGKPTVQEVEMAIRAVLAAIADTAKDFDGATGDMVYGANIMIFRSRDEPSQVTDALSLVHVSPSHKEYLGSLELLPCLSTNTSQPGEPDSRIKAICLPVPTDTNDYYDSSAKQTKSVLIPGAPTSYVKKTFDAFASIDDFLARLDSSTSIDRRHVGWIQQYFISGSGQAIKSFASLPIVDIPEPTPEDLQEVGSEPQADLPLAVLNIHSESTKLLADNGATLFAPLIGPFLNLLAILLTQRAELRVSITAGSVGDALVATQEGAKP